jgi:asparagine synthetase B (glutamine-hydrolysing)
MCGLFGAIGDNINSGTVRALAIANRERGEDALGFFSASGKMCKRAGDPIRGLGNADVAKYIDGACKGWFLAGHTRHATHGALNDRNAHPFRYGRIVGCHNGIVDYPRERGYQVDSQYLIDNLNRWGGNYQEALAEISGYWGLTWFDGSNFYLQAHKNTICLGSDAKGTWYYSSDCNHLDACVRLTRDFVILEGGATVRFDCKGKMEFMPTFVSTAKPRSWDYSITAGKKGKKDAYDFDDGTLCGYDFKERDRDDKWLDPLNAFDRDKNDWLKSNDWDEYTKDYN